MTYGRGRKASSQANRCRRHPTRCGRQVEDVARSSKHVFNTTCKVSNSSSEIRPTCWTYSKILATSRGVAAYMSMVSDIAPLPTHTCSVLPTQLEVGHGFALSDVRITHTCDVVSVVHTPDSAADTSPGVPDASRCVRQVSQAQPTKCKHQACIIDSYYR